MLDSSIVRAHQDAAGGRGGSKQDEPGRSRGILSTKLPAAVDMPSRPLEVKLTPGQQRESTIAETLIGFISGTACLRTVAMTLQGLSMSSRIGVSSPFSRRPGIARRNAVTTKTFTNSATSSKCSFLTSNDFACSRHAMIPLPVVIWHSFELGVFYSGYFRDTP